MESLGLSGPVYYDQHKAAVVEVDPITLEAALWTDLLTQPVPIHFLPYP